MSDIRVRFAPSPTGYLHIGSARTALFNWLFARHEGGRFYLRIEDTDKERSKDEFLEEILSSLKWLGLDWDGEPVFQSKRTDYYRETAERLIKKDLAYYEDRAIRFRMQKTGKVGFDDFLHGRIEFDLQQHASLGDDLVIFKSDGTPTYNFAVVCDDAQMGITHVIRGDDHISNTPKQLPLYDALGLKKPIFCHIPLILGQDRSRMSKRHGATSIREYEDAGYLPEAIVNYLALLGWSPGDNQELMSRKTLVEKFTLKRILKTGAVFSVEKLEWMNKQYLKTFSVADLTEKLLPSLRQKGYWKESSDRQWLEKLVALYQQRIGKLADFAQMAGFFFREDVTYTAEVIEEIKKNRPAIDAAGDFADCLKGVDGFQPKVIETATAEFFKQKGLTNKEAIHPYRLILTGQLTSPGFYDTLSLIGKDKVVDRLRRLAERLK